MSDSSNGKNILSPRHQLSLHYSVRDLVAKVNRGVLPERQITLAAALSVANREVVKNVNAPVDARIYAAQRAVAAFGSLATKNKVTTAALENSDLLAIGHPMSTKQHAMHEGSLRHARALWVAADSSIANFEVRALVATAHALEPGSIEREHAFARLFAAGPAVVPITVAVDLEPIIAVLGFGLGGNSRAARSLRAKMQRRDRRGRFAFMGGSWSFSVKFPDGSHRGVSGKTIGASGVDDIEVDVRGSKYLKDGVYTVPAKQGIAAKATLAARLIKNLPEREVSAEQQKYSIDSTALVRKDAPVGWTKIKNANANMSSYTTPDGYRLDVQDNNEGEPDFTADGGAKLYRAVGNTLVKDGVTSWDKVEQQALKDQDAYQKYLDSPEGQKALSSGNWGVDVSEKEIGAQGPSGARPAQGTDVVQQQSVTLNWQTEDGPVTKQGLAEWTEEYAPGVSADLLDDGTVKLTGSETNLRNAIDKATDGDYNATDYIMDSAQKESSGEPTAPVLVDTGASTSADPEIQKMEKAVSGFYDMEYGPGQIEMYNTSDSNDIIYVSDQDDAYNDAKRDGYRDTGKRVPGERIRTRRYVKPSGNTVDLDPGDLLSSLAVARQKGDMARFDYKGVPRVAQPGTTYRNPKNNQLNIRMFDHKKGEERTFAVKDITASKPKQPKPEAAKLAPPAAPAAPSVPGQAVDIPSTDVVEIAKVLNDAIASKSPVRFDYSGKTREFVPERIYTNPKTSKQNAVGFSKTDNEGRTFTLDKMSPPPPMGRPSVKPAAPEVTFEPKSPRPGFRDSYVDPRTGKTVKIPEDLLDKSMPPAYGLIYHPYLGGWYSAEIDPDAGFNKSLPEDYDPDPGFNKRLPEGFPREIIKDTPPSDVQEILDKLTPKNPDDGIVLYLNSQAIDGAINDLVEKSLIEPGTPVNRLSETDSVAQLETSIKKAILDKEDIAFTYHDKPRIVTPAEVVTNKIGKLQVKGFSRTDGEDRTFNIDKIHKPTAEVPTQVSDIKNMPQAEFDEYVEALWPSSEAAAPAELAQSSWPIDTLLPKESSAVARIDYDEDANEMLVAFKEKDGKGGGIYLYSEVSKNDYRGIASASSAGSAVGKFIKGRKFEKMNEVQASRWLASKFPVKPISTIDGNPMDDYLGEEPSVVRYLPPTRPKVTDADNWTNTRLDRFYDADGNLNKDGEDYNDERARTVSAGEPPAGGGPGGPSDAGTAPVGPRNKLQEVYNLTEKAKSIANKMIDSGTFDPDEAKKVNDLLSQADRLYTEFVGEVPGYDGYGTETFSSLSDSFAEAKSTEDVPDFDDALLDISRDLESFDQGGFGGPPAGGPGEPPAGDSTDDYKEAFDSMFVAPDGTYRPNVFDVYEPVGRRAEQSADYTDDPDVLATRYEAVDLAAAASRGIADGSGDALLDFEAGQEVVPVEAVLEALEKIGIDKESLLAKLYERIAKESNNNTIIDATKKASNDIDNSVLDDPDASVAEKMSVAEAAKLNGKLGAPGFTDNAFNLISSHNETNPNILSLARDIETEPERDRANSSAEIISRYLPWAFSNDPLERDAFRAYWGLILLSDGGDSDNWFGSDFESNFMRMLAKTLGELADGDVNDGGEILDRLTDEYGGFAQFAVGRQRISQGTDDLSAPTTAAALYRLTSAMAAPTSSELQRYIFVDEGTDAFDKYTTVGSEVVFDPRSFSTDDVMSRKPNEAFATFNGKQRKLIFRVPPGEMDAFDIHNYSWLPSEQEHVGYGPLKVEKVEKIGKLTYAVDLSRGSKPADIVPERPAAATGLPTVKNYGDVSSWTRVGQQLGSNSGGTFKDEDGNEYYVKTARSTSHAENEALASAFYKFFNIPASEVGLGVQDNDDVIITPMIPSTAGILQNYIGDAGTVAQLHDGFAIDAWLANYDVAGLEFDNVVVDSNGNAYRIDPGGALMWRAQGRRKDWFGPKVIELDSMRDQDTNYASSTLFGGMSTQQVVDSGRKLLDITPSQIDDIVASVVSDSKDSEMLKDVLKRRRSSIFEQLGIAEPGSETIDAIPSGPSPSNYVEPVGFEAQDLQPGDVAASDSFVIERIFRDGDTPSGKVSVQGYFPGHESQRKEWNEKTTIEVSRGGGVPPKGTAPALHRPKAPRKPSPGAFNGKMAELLKDAKTWEEAAAIIRGTTMVFFDYETTGLPGPEKGGKNEPVQIGAVKVVGGKVVDRFSSYMNPEHELSDWSAGNLKQLDGSPVTDDWLTTQVSKREAHEAFLAFVGDGPVILGGQYTPFDLEILGRTLNTLGLPIDIAGTIDSKDLSSGTLPKWSSKTKFGPHQVSAKDGKTRASNSLGPIAEFLQVQLPDWHRADADAEASWEITDSMLTRAIDNPDTPKTLLNVDDSYAETQRKLDEYNKEYKQYEEKLAEYAAAKAIAAAWNCGGSGITAAVGPENGPCSVPDIETMIREATPAPIGEIDPEGVTGGSTANETSMSDALEIDDPKHDGVDTNNPYKDEAFMPTEEQRGIIDAIMRGDDVVVEALAGTGKTSTLLIAGKRKKKEKPTERGVYIAFNKSAQLEAKRKFGDAGLTNIEVVTNDAISYRWAPEEIKDKMKRLKKKSPLAYYKDFAKEFGITEMEGKTLYEAVNLFKSAVNQYMISADDELGIQHFNAAGFEGDAPDWMLNIANNIWSDYTSPDGKAKINNTVVTKMWALARPDLSKIGFGLQSAKDFIFFDEAQDINPVSGKVIIDQSVQTVYVGDENQAIYGFRGGENQLAKVDKTVVRLPLTKSFRFGKNIAAEGNKWLQLLGSPLRIEGAGSTDGNIVPPGSLLPTANAILVRTNSGGFGAIFDQLGRDRVIGVTKNYRDDLVKMTDSAEYLITGQNRPSEMHEELAPFKSWAEVEKAIADEDIQNKKVEKFAELVDELGIDGLRDLIGKLRLVKGTGNIADTSEEAGEIGDVTPGSTGDVGMGVEYTVTDAGVSLSGNTYATRDAIKATKRFSYNGTTKTWDAKTKGEEDTFDLLNNLSTKISGDSGLAKKDTGPIDVMVTTVHQAKGLEWPSVAMWNDFFTPRVDKETGELVLPDPTEQKIAYVAVTRAMENLDLGGLDWINSVITPSAQDDDGTPFDELPTSAPLEAPATTPTPAETPEETPQAPKSEDFIDYANERIVLAIPTTIKERFDDALEDYADLDSLNEKKVKSFRKKVAGAMDAYKDGQYVDAEEMLRDAAELLDGTPFEEPLKSFLLQAADAADAVRAGKAAPVAPKTPEAPAAPVDKPKLDPEWRPSDVAPPQGATPSGTPAAPDDLLPVSDAPKTAGQEAEEKNKAFRSDATKSVDVQQKFDDLAEAVDIITGEDGSLKAMYRKRVREAMEKVVAIRKKLNDKTMSEQEALDELQQILDGFPEVISSSAESIDINFFRDMVQGVLDVLNGKYYWRPTGKHLPPLDAVDSTGRPVGYSRDGNTFIEPGMRVRDKWGFSGTVEGYNTNDWININIRYDIDWRDPDKVKKGSWGPGVGRRSMNPSTLTVLTPDTDNDPWIDLPTTPETKKPRMDLVEKQKKDWAKLKVARDYEAAARAAELKGEEAPPMPPGLALMKPSADLVRDSKKTKANISPYFNDAYDDQDVTDSTNDFSLSKNNKIIASDAVITTTDATGDPLVLMISRKYGPFTGARSLPGGFKDEGESFEAAADREMMEEVGISADQATSRTYLGEVSAGDWDPRAYKGVQVGAVAYQVPPDTPLKAGDDATGAEWVPIQDIIKGTVPIAFGHATWLAEAFKGTKYEAPLLALVRASKERNARLISQINAVRIERGLPTFDTPSPELWTPTYPDSDGGSGGDLPKADAPDGAPEAVEEETIELDNSQEKIATLGNNVATPDLRIEGRGAAPDHTPPDEEIIEMFLDGLTNPASDFVTRWSANARQFKQGDDPEAEDIANKMNTGMTLDEYDQLAADDPFLQNLYGGVVIFTTTFADSQLTITNFDWGSSYMDDWKLSSQPTYLDDLDGRVFWTDIAKYLYSPELLATAELTPAVAFLRTVRAAKPVDQQLARFLKFDEIRIDDEDHPFYDLAEVGQEIELRPSSWTAADNLSVLPMAWDASIAPGDSPEEFIANDSDNNGHVVLRVEGVPALNISFLSSITEEKEYVVTDGKYVVSNVKKTFTNVQDGIDLFYTEISLKPVATKAAKGKAAKGKAAAPEKKVKAPKGAAEIGDEISVPTGDQSNTASRIPDDDILVRLMTEGGSSDENVDFNKSWADHVSQYEYMSTLGDEQLKKTTDFLASLSGPDGTDLIDVDNPVVLKKLIDSGLMKFGKIDSNSKEQLEAAGAIVPVLHGIAGFTSGRFSSTDSKEEAKQIVEVMQNDKFAANAGGYANTPANYGNGPREKSVAEFWTNFAKIMDNPDVLGTSVKKPSGETDDEARVRKENVEIMISSAGTLLRALRVADRLEGDYTRVLHFMQDINDTSHPLHYMLNEGKEVTMRPTSWMKSYDPENKKLDDIFEYGNFGKVDGALGDVLFAISNPRALDAQPLPNDYGETEIILSGGKYRVAKVEKKETDGRPYTRIVLEDVTAEEKEAKALKAKKAKDDSLEKAPQKNEAGVPSKAEFIPNSYFTEILQKYYNTAERSFTDGILTQKDWDRIQSYFGADSIAVNNFLRSGKRLWLADDKDTIENVVKSIDDIFNVAGVELPGDVIVFKGIYDADKLFPFGVAGATPGDVFTDPGYSSTSIKSDVARTFTNTDETATVLAITVPSGTKMLANRIAIQAGQEKKEQEILLPRGLTFTVTSVKERTKPNKTYPFLPEVYKEIAVTVVSTSEAKAAAPEKVEAPEVIETPDLQKVIETGRPPVRVEDPKSLRTSAFQGIMSLADAVTHVVGKKQNDSQLGASALVDAADIEDLDVHVSVTEEDTGEFLQIKFKLTPWAALAQLNKIQQPESPLPELWDMRTPEIKKRTLKDNSRTIVTSDTAIEFANGIEYVHVDPVNNAMVSLTSAQKSSGKLEIHDSSSAGAPAALHGQVVIRLPIDAIMPEIQKALRIAGVRDVRAATKEDAKIVIENKLLSLFKQFNDPLQNVEEQDKRDALLADIFEDWGVAPDDVMLVPGQHGRINYILPEATAKLIALKTGTGVLNHSFSLSRLMMDEHARYYGVASPGDQPTYESGAQTKTFKSPTNQYATLIPEIAQVNVVAKAVFNAIQNGLLSSVTRFDVGLQYSGMSNREDMSSGGADYVFLTPKASKELSYYEIPTQLATASVAFPSENIFNRLDLYANENDLYGRRVPGTDAIEQSKPYGYETVVKHGIEIAAPGVTLNVHPKVRDRVLEMFKEEGVTQINGVELTDLMPILSRFDEEMALGNKAGPILSDAITSAGGNPDAITFGEVMALLQLTGAPASYPYVPSSSKVLMTSVQVRASKAKPDEDSLDTSSIKTYGNLLYVMHPNGGLVLLELGPLSENNQYGKVVSIAAAEQLALGLGSSTYTKDIGAITRNMTGNSFIAEDTGSGLSNFFVGQLLFPAGQKDAGVLKPVAEQLQKDGKEYQALKTYDEYYSYLNEFIDRYGYSPGLAAMTSAQKYEHYIGAYNELLNLYMSDIGSIVNSDGKSLRAAIVTALLTVRNRVLLQDDDLPVFAAAEPSGLPPVDYDVYRMTGNYITVPRSGAVIEDVDGERAGELRDVYHVGITTTTNDGVIPTGTYVEIETDREGRGGYYLDRGTSVTIDPVTNEIQFSSRGIKYMIRARRPSDEKYSRERAQQDGTR